MRAPISGTRENKMKKIALLCALTLSGAALAEDNLFQDVRAVLHMGLTGGGDKIDTGYVNASTGEAVELSAGGLFQIGAGFEWKKPELPVSARVTLNYHADHTSADNGSVTFSRIPLEVSAAYHVDDHITLGAGARFVSGAKYKSSVSGYSSVSQKFDSTTGLLLQVAYRFNPMIEASARYVSEKYTISGYSGSLDGSHGGAFIAFLF